MSRRQIAWISAALAGALLLYAWIDGGEEPMRPVVEPIAMPEGVR